MYLIYSLFSDYIHDLVDFRRDAFSVRSDRRRFHLKAYKHMTEQLETFRAAEHSFHSI